MPLALAGCSAATDTNDDLVADSGMPSDDATVSAAEDPTLTTTMALNLHRTYAQADDTAQLREVPAMAVQIVEQPIVALQAMQSLQPPLLS